MSIFSHFFSSRGKGKRHRLSSGFTVIELLVVSVIIVVITGFVLFRQAAFNSSTLLRSLAYSVAQSVRQAQLYGTSVRGFGESGAVFAPGHGIYLAKADPATYYLFADVDNDGQRPAGTTEDVDAFSIGTGYQVGKFCAITAVGAVEVCSDNDAITSLTIHFRRPNPNACIATSAAPGACAVGAASTYSSAYIQLRSASGDTRRVTVTSTGLIDVGAPGT